MFELSDDGAGVDLKAVRTRALDKGLITDGMSADMSDADVCALIFRPGFSTAKSVGELSGRGVGLDVVAVTLNKLGGEAVISRTDSSGTVLRLTVPTAS